MTDIQSQCWICPQCFDDRHHKPGDIHCLREQIKGHEHANSDLRQELTAARVENEHLLAANRDALAWFHDARDEAGRLRGRVCRQHDYLDSLVRICNKQAKLLDSDSDPLVELAEALLRRGDIDSGACKAWLLRKQAEAVEAATASCQIKSATDESKCYSAALMEFAKLIRQQADELENKS